VIDRVLLGVVEVMAEDMAEAMAEEEIMEVDIVEIVEDMTVVEEVMEEIDVEGDMAVDEIPTVEEAVIIMIARTAVIVAEEILTEVVMAEIVEEIVADMTVVEVEVVAVVDVIMIVLLVDHLHLKIDGRKSKIVVISSFIFNADNKCFFECKCHVVRMQNSNKLYRIVQQLVVAGSPLLSSLTSKAARVAASNTSSTFSPVKALHSIYLFDPILLATASACDDVTKLRDFFLISSTSSGSDLKSFFSPTNIVGTFGHNCCTSSYHLPVTFSNESGAFTANAINII
jgi:hypothetical protein